MPNTNETRVTQLACLVYCVEPDMRLRWLSLYQTAALFWSYSSTLHISAPHRHHGGFRHPATMYFFGYVMAVLTLDLSYGPTKSKSP